jgi:DNA-binding response OmpR family regulator
VTTLATPATSALGPSVLLVEDERSIAEPFAQALRRHGFRATIAATGAEALRVARQSRPDIVLLDLALPDIDGKDVCRELRRDSEVPIIMVTARGTITDRVVGLELGADDYIVKPFATGEAISRIRAVLRRTRANALADVGRDGDGNERAGAGSSRGAERGVLCVGELQVEPEARRAFLGGRELQLTRRELDLLLRLMQDAGRVVSRETLMAEVWDENWFGSTKTLDVHIASLRRKLEEQPASHRRAGAAQAPVYIHTVRGVGFRFAAPHESRD